MYPYTVIDTHCDSASMQSFCLDKSAGHLDLERMRAYAHWTQFFAIYTKTTLGETAAWQQCTAILENLKQQLKRNADKIVQVTNAAQITAAHESGKTAALISLEGAGPIGSDLSRIDVLYDAGVRCVSLTWNDANLFASGAGALHPKFGLTPLGVQAVEKLNTLGILVDVSHLSERAFWDVEAHSKAPFIASHSCAKKLCAHRRNLTDSQFAALMRAGGAVGINYYPMFLARRGDAATEDVVRHIEHFMALGGENHIGLGSDFDGIDCTPVDLCGVQDVHRIFERLAQLNYTQLQIEKIAGGNFYKVIQRVCG